MHSEHFVHKSMEVIKDCVVKSASMVYMTAFKKGTFSFCLCQVYKHKILIHCSKCQRGMRTGSF